MKRSARPRALLVALLAAAPLSLASPAAGSAPAGPGGHLGVPGVGEGELREFEADTLGPGHAAEHARLRQRVRAGDDGAAQPASRSLAPAPAASVGGRWRPRFSLPVMGLGAVMLPTGKVLWFAYPRNANGAYGDPNAPNTAQAWLWNPATGKFKRVDPPLWRDPADGKLKPANIWCAGQSLTADGRVVVAGGNLAYKKPGSVFKGLNKVYTFNPWNETWTEQPDMAHGRWYPSQVLMPDGRTVIMSGLDEHSQPGDGYSPNLDIDVFTPSTDLDGRGTMTKLGERRLPGDPDGTKPLDGGLYPHLFWMLSGRVLVAGPDPNDSWALHDPTQANLFGFDEFDPASRRRLWGTAVLLPDGPGGSTKVRLIGGSPSDDGSLNLPPTNTTETYDESTNAWTPAQPMHVARSHLNTVLLPDGSMVTIGGGLGVTKQPGKEPNQWSVTGDERQVELYDPVSGNWTLGAIQAESRAYHSTAVLLPDGRVVSAGDDYNGGIDRDTAEVYEPPYLFKGPRPSITSAPTEIRYGIDFDVGTPSSNIARAALVAPGATTHANDMNQRVVPVGETQGAGKVRITPPADPDIAPPGYYMLFLLDSRGVPSVARWVQLGWSPPKRGRIQITQRTEPDDPAARAKVFSFSGAPFDGVSLDHEGAHLVSVPGPARYPVTQRPLPGYSLASVRCDDSDSVASTSAHRASVRLSPGETVRCTFTSRRRPAPPAPIGPSDLRGPLISFARRGLDARRGTLSGTVADGSGVKRMYVGLARRRGARCRWWSTRRRRFARRRRSCSRPAWIRARLRKRGSGYAWRVSLHRRVRRGRYAVALRAIDGRGNATRRSGRSAVRIAVRR